MLFLTFLAGITFLASRNEPRLLAVSQRVIGVHGWEEAQLTVGMYVWLTPRKVVAFYPSDTARVIDAVTKSSRPFQTSFRVLRWGARSLWREGHQLHSRRPENHLEAHRSNRNEAVWNVVILNQIGSADSRQHPR